MIQLLHSLQGIRRIITGCHLISRHTTKNRIRPARTLSRTFQVFFRFFTGTNARHRVVLRKDTPFCHCREKIDKRENSKEDNHYYIR
ncbi:hypothetical protein IMSAGC004_01581 [Bacteroidaceae bacterium]|nr:hypothetical protein IMSAGC004_01581 [Bacteroidaceae bacterium]